MNKADKFITLFADFDFIVQLKSSDSENETKSPTKVGMNNIQRAKSELKKELKRLNKEYTRAKKSFKSNKINKQELFDFEWRIFEIHEELKRLDEDASELGQ